jgi:ketosteroid isomerase-like protein
MPGENIDLVRSAFEALRGALDTGSEEVLELFAPGIEWEVRADLPDCDTFRGHDGMRRLLESFEEVMEGMWLEPQEFIEAGERVVVPLRWGGRGRASGAEFEEREETWVFTLSEGRITRVNEFAARAAALEAAGLGE